MQNLPKGVHRVKKPLSNGDYEIYIYAWRGGPRLFCKPNTDDFHIEHAAALQSRKSVDGDTLYDLTGQYLSSKAFREKLAKGTKKYRLLYSDDVRRDLGGLTVNALSDIGVKGVFLDWHESFSATPKAADMRLETLSVILSYAMKRGVLSVNHAKGMPNLYKNDRSDIIWTVDEIELVKSHASDSCRRAIDFARLTGLRASDCVSITWAADKRTHFDWVTQKTGKRVFVPIIPELRDLLDKWPKNTKTVLETTHQQSWKSSSLSNAFHRARNKTDIKKRFHDLRGTFATMLVEKGVSDERVADVMGWSTRRISEIRRVYVGKDAIINDVLRQLSVN